MILGFPLRLNHDGIRRHVSAFDANAIDKLHARPDERQELVHVQATPAHLGKEQQSVRNRPEVGAVRDWSSDAGVSR